MPDTPRPGHNHPLDSLCLVIACPRGAYDAGKRAHIDALTAADVSKLAAALKAVGPPTFVGTKFDAHDQPYEGYYDWTAYATAVLAILNGEPHDA